MLPFCQLQISTGLTSLSPSNNASKSSRKLCYCKISFIVLVPDDLIRTFNTLLNILKYSLQTQFKWPNIFSSHKITQPFINVFPSPTFSSALYSCPWSSLLEGDEACLSPCGKLLCLWQHQKIMLGIIPHMFDCWVHPVVHLSLSPLKSSIGLPLVLSKRLFHFYFYFYLLHYIIPVTHTLS